MKSISKTMYDPANLQDVDGNLSAYDKGLNDSGFAEGFADWDQPAGTHRKKSAGKAGNPKEPIRFMAMFP
jgi:hypothetical protein